jgi:short-subunit dehydrogenase
MDLGIDDRVAIVTGASAGIGQAIALELASNGSSVVMVARNEKQLKQAAFEIRDRTSVDILTISADVGKPEAAGEIVTKAIDHFGRVDILINNAGYERMAKEVMAAESSAAVHAKTATDDRLWSGPDAQELEGRSWRIQGRIATIASGEGCLHAAC